MKLAAWLRAGRDRRNLTIEDVAKITKIQPRILEKLESGSFEGLPAAVFVKGFVRSFAKCVGLDESEAINRYSAAQAEGTMTVAQALVETMAPSSVRRIKTRVEASSPAIVVPAIEPPLVDATPAELAPVAPAEVVAPVTPVELAPVAPAAVVAPVTPVELAPVAPAEVAAPVTPAERAAVAPVELAPVASAEVAPAKVVAPVGLTPVASPAIVAPVETAASTETVARVETHTIGVEPGADATPAGHVASPVESANPESASPVVEAAATSETPARGKKKRSRKNSKQRARQKKQAQQELAAAKLEQASASPTDRAREQASTPPTDQASEQANAQPIASGVVTETQQAIDTSRVAKIDAASTDASSIEAKTTEPLDGARTDGTVEVPSLAEGSERISQVAAAVDVSEDSTASDASAPSDAAADTSATMAAGEGTDGTWQPTMPPISTTPSAPWRRPSLPATKTNSYVVPSLVIDDADPESADREREDRAAKEPQRLSFLPPILLDREDRSARQGGLTLAVIILLIAATLTLSYLMRRPSPSGDGMTMLDGSSMLVG